MAFFKTAASRTQTGNYITAATCKGTPAHTVYKDQMAPANTEYTCPYEGCGHDVN